MISPTLLGLVDSYGLLGIMLITTFSYSIIPFPSEAAVALGATYFNPIVVFFFALLGSTLGVSINYYIGKKGILLFKKTSTSKTKQKARALFTKYGTLSILFFSWLPLIGDPLTLLAGSFRMNYPKFLIYSTIPRAFYLSLSIWAGIRIESLL